MSIWIVEPGHMICVSGMTRLWLSPVEAYHIGREIVKPGPCVDLGSNLGLSLIS